MEDRKGHTPKHSSTTLTAKLSWISRLLRHSGEKTRCFFCHSRAPHGAEWALRLKNSRIWFAWVLAKASNLYIIMKKLT